MVALTRVVRDHAELASRVRDAGGRSGKWQSPQVSRPDRRLKTVRASHTYVSVANVNAPVLDDVVVRERIRDVDDRRVVRREHLDDAADETRHLVDAAAAAVARLVSSPLWQQ